MLKVLVKKAKAGEPWAIKELLDRCLGKPQQQVNVEAKGSRSKAAPVNMNLGVCIIEQMERLSRGPPEPGCRPLITDGDAPEAPTESPTAP